MFFLVVPVLFELGLAMGSGQVVCQSLSPKAFSVLIQYYFQIQIRAMRAFGMQSLVEDSVAVGASVPAGIFVARTLYRRADISNGSSKLVGRRTIVPAVSQSVRRFLQVDVACLLLQIFVSGPGRWCSAEPVRTWVV